MAYRSDITLKSITLAREIKTVEQIFLEVSLHTLKSITLAREIKTNYFVLVSHFLIIP